MYILPVLVCSFRLRILSIIFFLDCLDGEGSISNFGKKLADSSQHQLLFCYWALVPGRIAMEKTNKIFCFFTLPFGCYQHMVVGCSQQPLL